MHRRAAGSRRGRQDGRGGKSFPFGRIGPEAAECWGGWSWAGLGDAGTPRSPGSGFDTPAKMVPVVYVSPEAWIHPV